MDLGHPEAFLPVEARLMDTETVSGGPTYWWPVPEEAPTLNTRSDAP